MAPYQKSLFLRAGPPIVALTWSAKGRNFSSLEDGGPGEGVVAKVVIERAVQVIGARVGEDLDRCARVSPLLRVEVVGLDVHGLHDFGIRER